MEYQSASLFHMDIFKYFPSIFRHQNYMIVRLSIRMAKTSQAHLFTTCSSSQRRPPCGRARRYRSPNTFPTYQISSRL
jgi:hypothetical protein